MAKRISVLVALDGADEGLKRAITSAERSLGELSTAAKTSGAKAAAGIAEVKAGMSAFGEQVDRARTPLLAFVTLNWAGGKVQEIVQVADAWNMMSARLKLATAGQREYTVAQKELFAIAQRIGVPIQETATLYGKLQQAVRMLGGEQKDALSITESISQAVRLSGASATEAQSSLLQFGQALASGVLRGEEFNSVVENSPPSGASPGWPSTIGADNWGTDRGNCVCSSAHRPSALDADTRGTARRTLFCGAVHLYRSSPCPIHSPLPRRGTRLPWECQQTFR